MPNLNIPPQIHENVPISPPPPSEYLKNIYLWIMDLNIRRFHIIPGVHQGAEWRYWVCLSWLYISINPSTNNQPLTFAIRPPDGLERRVRCRIIGFNTCWVHFWGFQNPPGPHWGYNFYQSIHQPPTKTSNSHFSLPHFRSKWADFLHEPLFIHILLGKLVTGRPPARRATYLATTYIATT